MESTSNTCTVVAKKSLMVVGPRLCFTDAQRYTACLQYDARRDRLVQLQIF